MEHRTLTAREKAERFLEGVLQGFEDRRAELYEQLAIVDEEERLFLEDITSRLKPKKPDATTTNGTVTDHAGHREQDAVQAPRETPRRKRQRLPRGYVEGAIDDVLEEAGRFLHSSEIVPQIGARVRRDYPEMKVNRNTVLHKLRERWEDGHYERIVYDDRKDLMFHGLSRFVVTPLFGGAAKSFADPRHQPSPEKLADVQNPTPAFKVFNESATPETAAHMNE